MSLLPLTLAGLTRGIYIALCGGRDLQMALIRILTWANCQSVPYRHLHLYRTAEGEMAHMEGSLRCNAERFEDDADRTGEATSQRVSAVTRSWDKQRLNSCPPGQWTMSTPGLWYSETSFGLLAPRIWENNFCPTVLTCYSSHRKWTLTQIPSLKYTAWCVSVILRLVCPLPQYVVVFCVCSNK